MADIELNAREAGEGETILFIHGFPFDSALWEPQLAALPPGWQGLAPDLRGFGQSPMGGEPVHFMELLADDLAALLKGRGVEEAVICGLSMGGYVAFALRRRHPELVRALVLADTRPGADSAEGRLNRERLAGAARAEGVAPVVSAMLPKLVSMSTRLERPQVVEEIRAMMERQPPEGMARALLGMAGRQDAGPGLARIDEPVLVLVGEEDAITPRGEAQLMARAIRGARIEIIPEAGHVSNLEAPDAFNRALAGFLNGVRG